MRLSLSVSLLACALSVSAAPLEERNTCSTISSTDAAAVKKAFADAKIIPQAVNANIESNFPTVKVSAAYGANQANLGNTFTTLNTAQTPKISFTAESSYDPATTKYMVFLVDPDAPGPTASGSPALLSFFLHTAIYNQQPDCITAQSPVTVTVPGYRALTPLSIAKHRYLFLVYRQPAGFTPPITLAPITSNFDLNGFVTKNGLILVGGNFIREGATDVVTPT